MRTSHLIAVGLILASAAMASAVEDRRPANQKWQVADGSPKQLEAVIAAQDDKKFVAGAVVDATRRLKDEQDALRRIKASKTKKADVDVQTAKVAALKQRLVGLKQGTALAWPVYHVDSIAIGACGVVASAEPYYTIVQVIDGTAALVKTPGSPIFKVEHTDTTGWTDKQELWNDPWPLVFTGTATYSAFVGTNTVFVARPFGDKDFVYHPPSAR